MRQKLISLSCKYRLELCGPRLQWYLYGHQGPRHCLSCSVFLNTRFLPRGPIQLLEVQVPHPHCSELEEGKQRCMLSLEKHFSEILLTIFNYMPLTRTQSNSKPQEQGGLVNNVLILMLCVRQYFEGNISKEEVYNRNWDNQQCLSH